MFFQPNLCCRFYSSAPVYYTTTAAPYTTTTTKTYAPIYYSPPVYTTTTETVPWPFLSEKVDFSLRKKNKKKKKKFIRLVLKKSLDEPFPADFGGRSKWDLNLLKPWKEIESSNPSTLDEVREIVRAILYGYSAIPCYYFPSFARTSQFSMSIFNRRCVSLLSGRLF